MEDIIVPTVLFLTIGGVIALNAYFRYRTLLNIQTTVRAAIEQGQNLTPEVLEGLTNSLNARNADLRRGLISLALGAALFVFAIVLNDESALGPLMGLSAFPFLIGIAYVGLWFFLKRERA